MLWDHVCELCSGKMQALGGAWLSSRSIVAKE